MTVYFGNKSNSVSESPKTISQMEKAPAHEKIGNLCAQVLCALKAGNHNQISPLLQNLGVAPSDKEAAAEMSNLLMLLDDENLKVSPLASGIFLLKKKDPTSPTNELKDVAVFKVGRKRAAMESAARQLAHFLGLEKHIIPGIRCAVLGLPLYDLVEDEDTTEDLGNGNQKIYEKNKPAPTTVNPWNRNTLYNPQIIFDFEDGEELSGTNSSEQSLETPTKRQEKSKSDSDFTRSSEEGNTSLELMQGHGNVKIPNKSNSSDFTRSSEEGNTSLQLRRGLGNLNISNKSNSSDFTRSSEEAAASKGTASLEVTQSLDEVNESKRNASFKVTQSRDEANASNKSVSSDFTRTSEEENEQAKSTNETTSFDSYDETPAKKILRPPNHPISNSSFDSEDNFTPNAMESSEAAVFSTACAVVGIVQPFLFEKEEADIFEFTLMTIAALAIGLRDGKSDGFKGSMLYDVEDNFPIRIDPMFLNGRMSTSCAIDLPYLDQDERTKKRLSIEQVHELHNIVSKWDLFDIIKKMGKLELLYLDTACEEMAIGTSGKDEGNYEVKIIQGVNHEINGRFNALVNNPKRRILGKEQLNATNTRLGRIRDFIVKNALEETTFCPEELVDAVDIAGKIYKERLHIEAGTISFSTQCTLKTSGPHHITGRFSPTTVNLQSPITESEVKKKTRGALQSPTSSYEETQPPAKIRNPLSTPINISRNSSGGEPLDNFLGISISPIDSFDRPLMGSGSFEMFANSPNDNPELDWDVSPIGSPPEDFGGHDFFLSSSQEQEINDENETPDHT